MEKIVEKSPVQDGSAELPDQLDVWFQTISNEISFMEALIGKKDGFLFFMTHVYSEDELLSSAPFQKINAMIANIEAMFDSWMENSAVTDARRKFYWDNRLKIERRLGEVRARIIERQPTFWESIVQTIGKFVRFVMAHLPLLPQIILKRIGVVVDERQELMGRLRDIDYEDL